MHLKPISWNISRLIISGDHIPLHKGKEPAIKISLPTSNLCNLKNEIKKFFKSERKEGFYGQASFFSYSMMNDECPFCKIVAADGHTQIIKRGKHVTAIKKLVKQHPSVINYLIVSNEHIVNLKTATGEQTANIMAEIVELANELNSNNDWSMTINNGRGSNQTVVHLHAHIFKSSCR